MRHSSVENKLSSLRSVLYFLINTNCQLTCNQEKLYSHFCFLYKQHSEINSCYSRQSGGCTSVCYFVLCTCFPHVNKPHRFGYSFLTDSLCDRECWAALCLYLCRCSHSPLMDKFLCVCVDFSNKHLRSGSGAERPVKGSIVTVGQWHNFRLLPEPCCSCPAKQQSLHESHFSYD